MELVPVDHDPFAEASAAGPKLVSVDHDPFADAPTGSDAAAVGRGLINGVPVVGPYLLGGVNRAAAGIRALKNDTKFSDELRNVEGFGERTAAAAPTATMLSELAGGVIGTAPAVAAAPAAFGASAAPLAIRAGTSALTGGILGGGDAAVRSGGDLEATKLGAGAGFGLGLASPVAAAGAGRIAAAIGSRIRPPEAPPSVEALKSSAHAAYDRADQAGLQIGQAAFTDIAQDLARTAREAGIDKTIHPKATAAVGRVEEAIGSSPSLKETDLLRRVLRGAAGSLEPDERRIGKTLIERLDDRVASLGPDDVVSGNPADALSALREGRDLWGRARRAEMIDEATLKAERRAASTGSGGNVDNATRQNIRAILDNPKKARGFSQAERDAMETVVRGTPIQNAARLAGKLSPEGNGLALMLSLGGAAVDPRTLAASAFGFGAKRFADAGTARSLGLLDTIVRNGGELPVSPLALPFREGGERLGRGLSFGVLPVANQRLLGSR